MVLQNASCHPLAFAVSAENDVALHVIRPADRTFGLDGAGIEAVMPFVGGGDALPETSKLVIFKDLLPPLQMVALSEFFDIGI